MLFLDLAVLSAKRVTKLRELFWALRAFECKA